MKRRKVIYICVFAIFIALSMRVYAYELPKWFPFNRENALNEWQEKVFRNRVIYVVACLLVALFFFLRIPYWLFRAAFSRRTRAQDIRMAGVYTTSFFRALFGWQALCIAK